MNIQEIQEYHRHRFPYLLIDSIDEIVPGKSVKGRKFFTENEWLFHCNKYENQPVPFTMLIEILTQVFLLTIFTSDDNKKKLANFISADDVTMTKSVFPGDCFEIVAEVVSLRRGILSGKAIGYVAGEEVCSASMKFVLPNIMNQFSPSTIKN